MSKPQRYDTVRLGEWIVMPNHVHGIIMIDAVGAIHGSPLRGLPEPVGIGARRRRLLSQHVGFFKMNSSKQINSIRARSLLDRIRRYIVSNAKNWTGDAEKAERVRS